MSADKGRKEIEKKANALRQLRIEYVSIDSVEPNEYNPNRQSEHDFELLIRSIKEDGFTQPIIVHQDLTAAGKNPIVDGEHRWRAARQLGYTEIPVAKVNMTKEQMRIATLRHNRARGSEDVELAAQVLRELQELGALEHAQDSLMLSDDEINRLIEDIPAPEALAAETHTEAWEPAEATESADTSAANKEAFGSQVSMTEHASDRMRSAEKRIAEAKTLQERDAARRDVQVYRLVCVFSGDEAEVVKQVLGERQAHAVLELCREKLASQAS